MGYSIEMNSTIIYKESRDTSPLEATAKLLVELCASQTQIDAYLGSLQQTKNEEEKSNILDFLGSEGDIEQVRKPIVGTLHQFFNNTSEQEISEMVSRGYLEQNNRDELTELRRLSQL
jgi:hypothetical protein